MTRADPRWGWAVGLVLAVAVNALVLVLLARPAPPEESPRAPLAIVPLTVVPPPPPVALAATGGATPALGVPAAAPALLPLPDLPAPALPPSSSALPSSAGFLAGLVTSGPAVTLPTLAVAPPDQPAALLGAFDLARFYPREARLRGQTGRSRLDLTIDAQGVVTAVTVAASEPPGVFDEAAARLGRTLRFDPARRQGRPAPTRQSLVIAWTLQ